MVSLTSLSTELDWLLRILVAALCGTAIGYERATQRKSAGIRTHMVVAVASALFMLVSNMVSLTYYHSMMFHSTHQELQLRL